jgi:anti-anti-sigma factor
MDQAAATAPTTPLEIGTQSDGESVRLLLHGELDRTSAWALSAAAIRAQRSGAARLVIDLSDLTFIDAGGLRTLADVARRSRRMREGLVIEHPQPPVARVLHLTGLDRTIETH